MKGKRFLALLLSVLMCVSLLPVAAFAEDADVEEPAEAEVTVEVSEAPAAEEAAAEPEEVLEEGTEEIVEEADVLALTPAQYLAKCTSTATLLTIKTTAATTEMSLPCATATCDASTVVTSYASGVVLSGTVTAILKNTVNEYWYKLGDGRYVKAADAAVNTYVVSAWNPTITNHTDLTTLKLNASANIDGTVKGNELKLYKVTGYLVKDGEPTKHLMETTVTNANGVATLAVANSTINNSIKFSSLAAGAYTLYIVANAVYPYYDTATGTIKNMLPTTDAYVKQILKDDFSVGYIVKYDANGGTDAPAFQAKSAGTPLTLTTKVPTRTGYKFVGWATTASATEAEYLPGGTYTKDEAVTLYAVWGDLKYTIKFDANGGENAPKEQIKEYGSYITLTSAVPTLKCHECIGWSADPKATTATYPVGGTYKDDADVTLYAVWKEKHKDSTTTVAPTCTDKGYTTHVCSDCNKTWTDTYKDATGHSWSAWVSKDGIMTRTCANCKRTETKTDPGPGKNDLILSVGAATAKPGKQVEVTVALSNCPGGVSGIAFKVSYDTTAMKLSGAKDSTNYTGWVVSASGASWGEASGKNVKVVDGETVVTLVFDVIAGTKEGQYAVTLTDVQAVNADNYDVSSYVYANYITVNTACPGDANRDGKVTIKDLMLLKKYLVASPTEQAAMVASNTIYLDELDVDANSKVNTADAILIQQYLAGMAVTLK